MQGEIRHPYNGIVVQRYHMLPTPKPGEPWGWVYVAWRRLDGGLLDEHEAHTLTTFDGVWYGQIGNDPERVKYDHIPVGPERSAALTKAYAYRAMIATQYIHDAFPETRGHYAEEFGRIEILREA